MSYVVLNFYDRFLQSFVISQIGGKQIFFDLPRLARIMFIRRDRLRIEPVTASRFSRRVRTASQGQCTRDPSLTVSPILRIVRTIRSQFVWGRRIAFVRGFHQKRKNTFPSGKYTWSRSWMRVCFIFGGILRENYGNTGWHIHLHSIFKCMK